MKTTPQEMEVWYLLPSLRKEFARTLVEDNKMTQKKAAEILQVTEAAVSQYLNNKRAAELVFSKEVKDIIKESVATILSGKSESTKELYRISKLMKQKGVLCQIHMKHDPTCNSNCDLCQSFGDR